MIKLEVIEPFSLSRFGEIKNLVRKKQDVDGKLNKEDVFECEKDLADYLLGENAYKKPFVRIIEVIPEVPKIENVEKAIERIEESAKEEVEKPKKSTRKRVSKK